MNILNALETSADETTLQIKELEGTIEETKDDIEELVDDALPSKQEPESEEQEEEAEEDTVDGEAELEEEEEDAEEAELPDDQKKQNQAFAMQRRENTELKERLAKLEGAAEERAKSATPNKVKEPVVEPDKALYPEDWAVWKSEQNAERLQAQDERQAKLEEKIAYDAFTNKFNAYDTEKQANDEIYKGSREFIINAQVKILKAGDPLITDAQIKSQIDKQIIEFGIAVSNAGMDPASYLKTKAMEAGYVYTAGATAPTKKKVNSKRAASNKRKGASLMGDSGGATKQKISADELADMSLSDKMNLTDDEWDDLAPM